jgi:hypothetical protein
MGTTRATTATPASTMLSESIRTKICNESPCGGDRPSIRIYRDATGTVKKLYRIYGSCFHSPGIYFEPDGARVDVIPEKPIEPGSDEARALKERHDRQVGGLTFTDVISCRDGSRSAP